MPGVRPEQPLAVGSNCGVGASDLLLGALAMTEADPNAIVVGKANCIESGILCTSGRVSDRRSILPLGVRGRVSNWIYISGSI